MSDITEGIGGAIEGALAGRAVEPRHGEAGDLTALEPRECLNCGGLTTTPHCPQCGQKREVHRSLAAIGHDIVHGVLHLDGKLWRTLPLLVWKPGELTRRYIEGERAKFVSPMAMFLFSVFLMFAVFQVAGISTPTTLPDDVNVGETLEEVRIQAEQKKEEAETRLAELPADSLERQAIQTELAEADEALDGLEQVEQLGLESNQGNWTFSGTGIQSFDEGLVKKWQENPGLMLYKLQNNAYKFSWLLIPISIPFVWVMFAWKRRFKAYDHAIFVTYSLAFMSMLFIVLSTLGAIGVGIEWLALPAIFIPPIHMYRQLKGAYELSRFSAFWRTAALVNMTVFVVIGIFLWLLLLLGAF